MAGGWSLLTEQRHRARGMEEVTDLERERGNDLYNQTLSYLGNVPTVWCPQLKRLTTVGAMQTESAYNRQVRVIPLLNIGYCYFLSLQEYPLCFVHTLPSFSTDI